MKEGMNEWRNAKMAVWAYAQMHELRSERVKNERVNLSTNGRKKEWKNICAHEQMNEWMNERMYKFKSERMDL